MPNNIYQYSFWWLYFSLRSDKCVWRIGIQWISIYFLLQSFVVSFIVYMHRNRQNSSVFVFYFQERMNFVLTRALSFHSGNKFVYFIYERSWWASQSLGFFNFESMDSDHKEMPSSKCKHKAESTTNSNNIAWTLYFQKNCRSIFPECRAVASIEIDITCENVNFKYDLMLWLFVLHFNNLKCVNVIS